MKKQHFAILAAAALITAAMATASAQPGKHNVRSITDTIRTNSNGRVTITCSDGVEALAVIDTTEVRQPSARHESDTDESPATTTQRRHAVHRADTAYKCIPTTTKGKLKQKRSRLPPTSESNSQATGSISHTTPRTGDSEWATSQHKRQHTRL